MQFPKRTSEHIMESLSWRRFEQCAPDQWIIREVTERDYGIDAYVEMVTSKGEVTGDLCSIQLKGTETIHWSENTGNQGRRYHLAGIKKATVNYWMHLPVPVFVVLVDTRNGRVYFAPVKNQVRKHYSEFCDNRQRTFGFDFYETLELGQEVGTSVFVLAYFREKSFSRYSEHLRSLLIHWRDYFEYIVHNQSRDQFLQVDDQEQLKLIHIYVTLESIADTIGIAWNVIDLKTLYREDRDAWHDPYALLHELSRDKVLRALQPIFKEVLQKAKDIVVNSQASYWSENDPLLYQVCCNLNEHELDEI